MTKCCLSIKLQSVAGMLAFGALMVMALYLVPSLAQCSNAVLGDFGSSSGHSSSSSSGGDRKLQVMQAHSRIPLHFIENQGQLDKQVKFYEKGSGHSIHFTQEAIYFSVSRTAKEEAGVRMLTGDGGGSHGMPMTLKLAFLGASPCVEIAAEERLKGRLNYFIGNDPRSWIRDVPAYKAIVYREVYPGVDVRFYGNNRKLEYDVVVKPGADPSRVRLQYSGIESLEVDREGDLHARMADGGVLIHKKPVVYQVIDGNRVAGQAAFKILDLGLSNGSSYSALPAQSALSGIQDSLSLERKMVCSFEVSEYDRGHALVIDPVLVFSSYLGGFEGDYGWAVALDTLGSSYLAGTTQSIDFPTQNPYQQNKRNQYDVFVTKFDSTGAYLVYSTYIGGSGSDFCYGLAVDGYGNAYLTGTTDSADYPAPPPTYQAANAGQTDSFVTKINEDGDTLSYSTYLGGTGRETGYSIALDSQDSAYVTGETSSADFPTSAPYQAAFGGQKDAFIVKLNAAGTGLAYSTFLGGSNLDLGRSIAVDDFGNASVTGFTISGDFPTSNALQSSLKGQYDAFAAKLAPTGDSLLFSTYLGGSGFDYGYGVALDLAGNLYVTGETDSADYYTSNAFQEANRGGTDAFLTKISAAGDVVVYSTYLGGTSDDLGRGVAVDSSENAFVTGSTSSTDFPVETPLQTASGGNWDGFLAKLGSDGKTLAYSSWLGGTNDDFGNAVAVDSSGDAHVAGYTESYDFPVDKAFQDAIAGAGDAFLSKISERIPDDTITVTSPDGGESWEAGSTQTITWTYTGAPGSFVKIELLKAGLLSSTIAASASMGSDGFGSYSWTIPAGQASGDDYTVRVTSTITSRCTDTSNGDFSITLPLPSITLTSPNGAELGWVAGTRHRITWTYVGNPGPAVKIELMQGGSVVRAIASSTSIGKSGSGGYYWQIPTRQTAGAYTVRVTSTSLPLCGDSSDATFDIAAAGTAITLTYPNGGETLQGGSTATVRWTYAGTPGGTVSIDLLKAGVATNVVAGISIGSSGRGFYSWTVPVGQTPASDYKLKVTATGVADSSNKNFKIVAPVITVISPNGGENIHAGSSHKIRWTYKGNPGNNVQIDLLEAGEYVSTIIASTSIGTGGSGSYTWAVPLAQSPAADYRIQITSTTTTTCTDTSNEDFTIDSPSITVSSPDGGEKWGAGSRQTIRWSFAGNPGPSVKIDLYKAGVFQSTIVAAAGIGAGGVGSYAWTIPAGQTAGADYTVLITSVSIPTCFDSSGSGFSISAPSLSITSPNGGEIWQAGASQIIRWTYTGNPGSSVKLELLKGGSVVSTIASTTSIGSGGSGTHSYTVPVNQTAGTDYTIRITSTSTASCTDTSNGNFTVNAPSIAVITPNGGETLTGGLSQTLRWSYTGNPGANVKIDLLKAGTTVKTLASATSIGRAGSGSFACTIPASVASGADYTIQITSTTTTTCTDTSDGDFTIMAPTLTLITPNGGEIWGAGASHTISWSYTGNPGANVKIELLKAGLVVKTITSTALIGTGGSGLYSWTSPSTLTPGADYTVRVTSTTTASCTDTSDAAFTIIAPTLTVSAPNGGESWAAGSAQTIRWTYTGSPGAFVKIELLKSGSVVKAIVANTSIASRSYSWTVPSTVAVGTDYAVKVTSTSTATCTDTSDDTFSITGADSSLTITSPNGGETWQAGSQQMIRWSYTGSPGPNVKLELLKAGALHSTITSSTSIGRAGAGTFKWTLPSSLASSSDYTIQVISTTSVTCTDVSDAPFSITSSQGSITVTSPNGGETWQVGSTQVITWSYTGSPGASVKIELLQAGSAVSTISSSTSLGTSGTGMYSWAIPTTLVAGTDYTVRITSTSASISDTSDTTFSLY